MTTLFVDLDGVLADFCGGVFSLFQRPDLTHEDITDWGIAKFLGISNAVFWQTVKEAGEDFWAHLDHCKDFKELWEAIVAVENDPYILSHLPDTGETVAAAGKVAWINRFLASENFMVGKGKHELGGPGKILLDDCSETVALWEDRGGVGILLARPWNRGGMDTSDVIDFLPEIVRTVQSA